MRTYLCLLVCLLCSLSVTVAALAREGGGQVFYDLGVFALAEGDLPAAEAHFREALGEEPGNVSYNHQLGRTYLEMERFTEALPLLIKAYQPGTATKAIQYDLAMARYKLADYQTAAKLFVDLADRNPDHGLARYYAGLAQYHGGDYKRAVTDLELAAGLSSGLADSSTYFTGLSLYRLGDNERAEKKLAHVENNALDPVLRSSAAEWLAVIRETDNDQGPFSLSCRVGLKYDDNVRLEPLDEDVFTDEDDMAGVAYLTGTYNVLHRPTLKVGLGYSHYQTWQADLGDFDLTGSLFSFYVQKESGSLTYVMSYLPAYYWLDSASFLRRHQLRPELLWQLNATNTARLSYTYSDEHYFQDMAREGSRNELALGLFSRFFSGRATATCELAYESKAAFHPDEDFTQITAGLGWNQAIFWRLQLNLAGSYRSRSYDTIDSLAGLLREDDRLRLSAGISRPLWSDSVMLGAEYQYTENDSTIAIFSYEKNALLLFLSVTY